MITITERIETASELVEQSYTDDQIRELFSDDKNTLVIALLDRSIAAEAEVERLKAVESEAISEFIDPTDGPYGGVTPMLASIYASDNDALTLTWTDEAPTEPGWYWCEYKAYGTGKWVIGMESKWTASTVLRGRRWAGPIPKPPETTDA